MFIMFIVVVAINVNYQLFNMTIPIQVDHTFCLLFLCTCIFGSTLTTFVVIVQYQLYICGACEYLGEF
jgi:hypothetical protein